MFMVLKTKNNITFPTFYSQPQLSLTLPVCAQTSRMFNFQLFISWKPAKYYSAYSKNQSNLRIEKTDITSDMPLNVFHTSTVWELF